MGELGADDTGVSVRAGNLAPDDAELGAANLLLGLVDVGDLLAEVEVGSVGVVNTLNLDQTGLGVRCVAVTLVGKVTTPVIPSLSAPLSSIKCEPFPIRCASWFRSSGSSPHNVVPVVAQRSSISRLSSIPIQAPHFAYGSRPSQKGVEQTVARRYNLLHVN